MTDEQDQQDLQHAEALAGGIADMAQEALKYCLNNVPDMFETYEELDSETAKLLVKFFIMGYGCGVKRSVQDEAADESMIPQEIQSVLTRMSEYAPLVVNDDETTPGDAEIIRRLKEQHDWTDRAAEALMMLARQYGAFMLRNALALAIVMDTEDGELGF